MEEKIERFLEFIRDKGGASAVAKKIGKHPQFVYNIEQGKGKPNFETLTMMKDAYPDLDLNWIFTGVKTEVSVDAREMEFVKRRKWFASGTGRIQGGFVPKI